jgi:hypothetical protein
MYITHAGTRRVDMTVKALREGREKKEEREGKEKNRVAIVSYRPPPYLFFLFFFLFPGGSCWYSIRELPHRSYPLG